MRLVSDIHTRYSNILSSDGDKNVYMYYKTALPTSNCIIPPCGHLVYLQALDAAIYVA